MCKSFGCRCGLYYDGSLLTEQMKIQVYLSEDVNISLYRDIGSRLCKGSWADTFSRVLSKLIPEGIEGRIPYVGV